jgi:hypothetical protein
MLTVGSADVAPILQFPANLAANNDKFPIQNFVDLVYVRGKLLKFVLDLGFEEL